MNLNTSIPVCPKCLPLIKSGKINQLADNEPVFCSDCGLDIPSRQYFYILEHNRKGQKPIAHVVTTWEQPGNPDSCPRCLADLVPSLITGELVCTHCQGGSVRKSKMTRGAK